MTMSRKKLSPEELKRLAAELNASIKRDSESKQAGLKYMREHPPTLEQQREQAARIRERQKW